METVNILVEALPYIKKFHQKKIMIKYGGHAMIDATAKSSTARDTVLLKYVGMQPMVVHGGGPEISRSMSKLGKEPKFIGGLRITDQETMEIVKMVLVGKISTEIVANIALHGVLFFPASFQLLFDLRNSPWWQKGSHLYPGNCTGQ